jgi:hypothetical protein
MWSNINTYLRITIVNHIIFLLLINLTVNCPDVINQCIQTRGGSTFFLLIFFMLQILFELLIISAFIISISSKTVFNATKLNASLFLVTFFLSFSVVF